MSLRPYLFVSLLLACGPSAPMTSATAGDTSTGASTGGPVGSTTSTSTSSTTSAVDPTTGGDTSAGSTGTTLGFIVPSDFICLSQPGVRCSPECSTWQQDCPEGEKCSPFSSDGDNSWDAQKCAPLDPDPDHAGEPCTVEGSGVSGIDSCDIESMCWAVDGETLTGTCVPFCKGSPEDPTCPPDSHCLISNDGALTICLPQCDPLLQDCPNGDLCVPNPMDPNAFVCVIDASGEEGQAFDPCEFANACDAGLICATPALASECPQDAAGCCLPFCDTTLPDCPGAMQQCLPWYEMDQAPPGSENIGLCGLPQ